MKNDTDTDKHIDETEENQEADTVLDEDSEKTADQAEMDEKNDAGDSTVKDTADEEEVLYKTVIFLHTKKTY